ncbi:hypothetical protein BD410DRAFT_233862 [Rickenella mellea]|uniref:BZIP domain-containing protein n=1 Tax=Rickenella mellea TaxID=50990 RepID=A0A4Y7QNG0_9AGAM|nr:hypothetical protein BD410DRAFT_233862 [Rickenella mellea]
MARGRKKDLTIPQTRALSQQRAYRDRRAKYVSELEERCRALEDENTHLKARLAAHATTTSPAPSSASPEMVGSISSVYVFLTNNTRIEQTSATRNLLDHLSSTSQSIGRLQQLVVRSCVATNPSNPPPTSLDPTLERMLSVLQAPHIAFRDVAGSNTTSVLSEESHASGRDDEQHQLEESHAGEIYDSESECCGGLMDCKGLIEEPEECHPTAVPVSNVRSQSQSSAVHAVIST